MLNRINRVNMQSVSVMRWQYTGLTLSYPYQGD